MLLFLSPFPKSVILEDSKTLRSWLAISYNRDVPEILTYSNPFSIHSFLMNSAQPKES